MTAPQPIPTDTTEPTTPIAEPAPVAAEPIGPTAPTFEPRRHLTRISGAEYLEVKWRLVWFRDLYPNGSVDTELVSYTEREAVFKASVVARDDQGRVLGSATSYGSEKPQDFRDYFEKAETKAIGRALAVMGFGTQFTDDHANGTDRPVDSPTRRNGNGRPASRPASGNGGQRPAGNRPTGSGPAAVRSEEEQHLRTAALARIDRRVAQLDWSPEELTEYAAMKRGKPAGELPPVREWGAKPLERLAEYLEHFPNLPPE